MMNRPTFNAPLEARRRPGTVGLIAAILGSFVLGWVQGPGAPLLRTLGFDGDPARFWTFLTYPFASSGDGRGLFFVLILCLWLWFVAGSVEEDDGTMGLIVLFASFTVLGALMVWLGMALSSVATVLAGPSLPVAALTVVWATRRPDAPVMLFGVFPLAGKWVAAIAVAMLVFGLGTGAPLVGLLAGVTCLAAWWYARQGFRFRRVEIVPGGGRGPGAKTRKEFDGYVDKVREREREREERERLRRLLEGSVGDDDPSR